MTAKAEEKSEEIEVVPDSTPYRARYKSEQDKEAPLSTDADPDKKGESDAVQDAKPEETIVTKSDDTYKKRYDSLKSHHDKSINEARADLSKLREQLSQATNKPLQLPKSPEDIAKWRAEFPDVYDLVVSISRLQVEERAKQTETRIQEVEKREKSVARDKALLDLKLIHSDFDNLIASQDFHDWIQQQPQQVQDWLYNNTDNAKLAGRAIDLYKADKGVNKTTVKETAKVSKKEDAALEVSTTKVVDPDLKQKKVWKLSEIRKLKPHEFEKAEKEIDLARREGRIVDG